jgi:hypothetical protein
VVWAGTGPGWTAAHASIIEEAKKRIDGKPTLEPSHPRSGRLAQPPSACLRPTSDGHLGDGSLALATTTIAVVSELGAYLRC